ncbi:MAG: hypothetical protein ACOCUL_03235, partial [Bacteroidota bacterium]
MNEEVHCRICSGAVSDIGEKWKYRIVSCNTCGFKFCPSIDDETLKEMYQSGWHGVEDGAPESGWCDIHDLAPVTEIMTGG